MRTPKQTDIKKLQQTITSLEEQQTFKNQKLLWEAVQQSEWGQQYKVSTSFIAQTAIKNSLIFKTAPARKRAGSLQTASRPIAAVKQQDNDILDIAILQQAFRSEGIEITGIESLLTSKYFTPEENQAVRRAWGEVRKIVNVPGPKLNKEREYVE